MANNQNISRRTFMTGAGAAAVAASVAAAAPAAFAAETTSGQAQPAVDDGLLYTVSVNPQRSDYRGATKELSTLFSPWKLGKLELGNRICKSAAGSATYLNGLTDELFEYYLNFAKGGVQMIWMENVAALEPSPETGQTHRRGPGVRPAPDLGPCRVRRAPGLPVGSVRRGRERGNHDRGPDPRHPGLRRGHSPGAPDHGLRRHRDERGRLQPGREVPEPLPQHAHRRVRRGLHREPRALRDRVDWQGQGGVRRRLPRAGSSSTASRTTTTSTTTPPS